MSHLRANRGGVPRTAAAPAVCAGLLGLVVAAVSAQAGPTPGFSLSIDFMAVDGRGNPITDLRADEIQVKLERQTAGIRELRLVPAASDHGSTAQRSKTGPFGSLEAANFERSFLIAVDDESLPQGSEQSTRDALRNFINRLDPRDRIGIAVIPHGDVRVLPTTDHGRVLPLIARVSGRASGREVAADAACRTQRVLRELNTLLGAAQNSSGPVILVLFSGSMYDGAVQQPLGTSMACDVQLDEFRQVGLQASRSRTYVYIVQPETFGRLQWTSSPRSGLEQLAGATGGRILDLSGREVDVLDQVRRETSALYVAHISLKDQPRSPQTLSVRTSRPDVIIVARPKASVPAGRSTRR